MLVTLKFRPRTTSPKSGARERENGKGGAERSKFGSIRRTAPPLPIVYDGTDLWVGRWQI